MSPVSVSGLNFRPQPRKSRKQSVLDACSMYSVFLLSATPGSAATSVPIGQHKCGWTHRDADKKKTNTPQRRRYGTVRSGTFSPHRAIHIIKIYRPAPNHGTHGWCGRTRARFNSDAEFPIACVWPLHSAGRARPVAAGSFKFIKFKHEITHAVRHFTGRG